MGSAAIAAMASVIVVVIATVGQVISARNDRALAHQEVDLLKKLQPGSKAATDLETVIGKRIGGWRAGHDASRFAFRVLWVSLVCALIVLTLSFGLDVHDDPERAWRLLPLQLRIFTWVAALIIGMALGGAVLVIISRKTFKSDGGRWLLRQLSDDQAAGPDESVSEASSTEIPPKPSAAHSPNSQHPAVDATSGGRT
jgi:uncharacterized membrane protein YbjE (DUF340 family)